MSRQTLHWVCHSPSPYNDFLFQALAQSREIELRIHYLYARSEQHCWEKKDDRGYPLRYFRRRPLDWKLVGSVLKDRSNLFLTACWQDPTCQFILILLMMIRRPFFVWSDCPLPRRRNWLKGLIRSNYLSAVFRHAAGVLGTGAGTLREFARMGAPEQCLINFPYCVDSSSFAPRRGQTLGDSTTLGTASRLVSLKGIDVALRALAHLASSGNPTFRYRIAGAGPEEGPLKELCANLGLADRVEFCGWLGEDDLPGFYQSLDAYLHPARFEPYGVAVMEALACGLPVLASSQTLSAVEHVVEGSNGFLHQAGCDVDLERTLRTFLSLSSEEMESMRSNARRAGTRWTLGMAVSTVERLAREAAPQEPQHQVERRRA